MSPHATAVRTQLILTLVGPQMQFSIVGGDLQLASLSVALLSLVAIKIPSLY